jgi:glycogen debranching enzyme
MESLLAESKPARFYISTQAAPVDERSRVLKYGKMFSVFDRFGDITPVGLGEEGIFFEGTRFLSEWALFIGQKRPLLLSSTVRRDNVLFTADLTNVDITLGDNILVPRGTILVTRAKTLWKERCYEQLVVSSYALSPVVIPIALEFDSDFADLFEVRGTKRPRKGEHLEPALAPDHVVLSYRGLDNINRFMTIESTPPPGRVSANGFQFDLWLRPREKITIELELSCSFKPETNGRVAFASAISSTAQEMHSAGDHGSCFVHSSSDPFNNWLRRSAADVQMMIVGNPEKDYPYAGVPWFSTVFGRDGIITALECLWKNPQIARGVLEYLAATQATEVIPEYDAEPGKILHEARHGEMATLKEIPFGRYYGSIDSTPLFIMLAYAYYQRTADLDLIRSLWPNIEAALGWIDKFGDRDGDGFVEYARRTPKGLVQQGWKDSSDSVFHADGSIAEPPIALCEVQGYVYDAKCSAARLARLLGRQEQATQLEQQARTLQRRFEECFWSDEIGMYALALDGRKQPCLVRTSNPGHCLFTGIASPDHGIAVARKLLTPEFFSGWGIRTVALEQARYNPVSYHNGSVWPHDNAMCALGMARYGERDLACRVLTGLFDLSGYVDLHRLPELFCGLDRRPGEGPTLYPSACSPQAWAAGTVFMFLEACLGLSIDAPSNRISVSDPRLPESISHFWVRRLQVGSTTVDLHFERTEDRVRAEILEKRGGEVDIQFSTD